MRRKDRCVVCDRRPVAPGEGRRIDGSWAEDRKIYRRYHGRWVCCHGCYMQLPRVAGGRRVAV